MNAVVNWAGRQFRSGSLTLEAPDGATWTLGRGAPHARIRLRNRAVLWRILRNPALQLGETYTAGDWEPQGCDLRQVLDAAVTMSESQVPNSGLALAQRMRSELGEFNSRWMARLNVHRHYDLDPALYAAFLDSEQHYSCAYFQDPSMSLESAQQAKCALIAAKLDLPPNARVLDVGCGWGALALYLAERHGARVTGITLSQQQQATATARALQRGLSSQVEFRLADYRSLAGCFDAIVSVGMFEHVGRPQYATFFRRLHELLVPQGTALLHTIGRSGAPGATNPWIRRHIFPGGYIPAASEVISPLERSGLRLTDFEIWRMHYALTLAEWNRRFQQRRREHAERLGERFCRMWEFYLQACEASFRCGSLVVFQLQFTRALRRLPLTRDYLYRERPSNRAPRETPAH